jgi:hypothetical protein
LVFIPLMYKVIHRGIPAWVGVELGCT